MPTRLILAAAILALAGTATSQTTYKTPKASGRGWSDGTVGGGYVKPDPNYKPSRTPDGQPDIQGIWRQTTLPGGTGGRNSSIEAIPRGDVILGDLPTGTSIVDPPDGRIPYQPWARAKVADLFAHYIVPLATCVPIGMPSQMGYNFYEIIQAPREVVIVTEAATNFRHIPLDGSPHPGKNIKLYMGDSRGHWEGNTLVIDVANLNDKTWMSVRADFHSDQAHMVERLTPVGPDTIQYEVTLDDPAVYDKPWKIAYPLFRNPRKNYELLEENCAEGNKSTDAQIADGRKLFPGLADVR